MTTCPTYTREYDPAIDVDCPHCAELDALLAEWAKWEANQRYNAEQWAREGGASWYSGDRVGR